MVISLQLTHFQSLISLRMNHRTWNQQNIELKCHDTCLPCLCDIITITFPLKNQTHVYWVCNPLSIALVGGYVPWDKGYRGNIKCLLTRPVCSFLLMSSKLGSLFMVFLSSAFYCNSNSIKYKTFPVIFIWSNVSTCHIHYFILSQISLQWYISVIHYIKICFKV